MLLVGCEYTFDDLDGDEWHAFWVAGMGFRFAFAIWSTGSGAADVTRFSIRERISSGQAWTTALVLMAVGEVLARVSVLQVRRGQLQQPRVLTHA